MWHKLYAFCILSEKSQFSTKYFVTMFFIQVQLRGALSVMVIIAGNRISDQSSNPGRGCLHFVMRMRKVSSICSLAVSK